MSPVGGQSLKENSLVCFLSLEIQCNQTHVIPPFCLDHQEAQKSYFSHSIVIAAHNLSVGHIVILSYHQLLFGLKFSLCNTDYFFFNLFTYLYFWLYWVFTAVCRIPGINVCYLSLFNSLDGDRDIHGARWITQVHV